MVSEDDDSVKVFLFLNKGLLFLAVPCWSGSPTNIVLIRGASSLWVSMYRNMVLEDNNSAQFIKQGVLIPE